MKFRFPALPFLAVALLALAQQVMAVSPEDSLRLVNQGRQAAADTAGAAPATKPVVPADTVPRIVKIWCPEMTNDSVGHFDHQLVFTLSSMAPFVGQEDNLVLYVDGLPMPALKGVANYSAKEITFRLNRDPELLKMFTFGTNKESFRFSPGVLNGYFIRVEKDNFTVVLFAWGTLFLAGLITATSIFLVLYLGVFKKNPRSVLLRESLGGGGNDQNKPFSLSKVQLAFWTVIIGTSILYLWLITGEYNLLTPQAMLLLGISVTTTGLSAVVGTQHSEQEKAMLEQMQSDGFFVDILSDAKGISITRMQNFLFTLIYGLIFVVTVARQLKMPEFDNNALILMGISSGAYVLYKVVENKGAVPSQNPPAQDGGGEGSPPAQ